MPLDSPQAFPAQLSRFPPTRYMGSKEKLLGSIWELASTVPHDSLLDLFSGSGAVAYLFKTQGKAVVANDYMAMARTVARATLVNSRVTLTDADLDQLLSDHPHPDGFVARHFAGLYFGDAENRRIDHIRAQIAGLDGADKRALAMAALIRACMKKRPRGIFTYTGRRYDDGRRDLRLSLEAQFREQAALLNDAVFDNGRAHRVLCADAMQVMTQADLVYIDPPYFSPLSDNEYVRRYHFLEGLARGWRGVEMQWHTKTRKFRSYPTPFSTRAGAYTAFERLFRRHRESAILVSYASNAQPTKEELLALLKRYKKRVELTEVDHRYSFATQGEMAGAIKNGVREYLFLGR